MHDTVENTDRMVYPRLVCLEWQVVRYAIIPHGFTCFGGLASVKGDEFVLPFLSQHFQRLFLRHLFQRGSELQAHSKNTEFNPSCEYNGMGDAFQIIVADWCGS
jgi:hypothetical protein